ncbi:tetratricopeptide repeat protein [Thioalkalivibrio sp. ALMg13-2]|uniref:tetratricopeptide repeat protein n=1 Tax=Thioalkalivibrio sp. ALMg13-2 TaxID=1158167 RepID=UPI000381DFDB|nr:tetratricopeptide repeat protein [Thioalkalivibrio sp. ALMg13-2]
MTAARGLFPLASILLALLLVQGCAALDPFAPPEQRIERALETGNYQHALELIDEHDPEPRARWAERRAAIEEEAATAAAEAMHEARAASAEGAVAQALEILETAEAQLPPDSERREFISQLERQRQVGLQTLQQRHDILEARALVQRLRLLEVMRPLVRHSERLPDDPDRLANRREPLARALDGYAADTDGEERLELLHLAQGLASNSERAERIARLERELRQAEAPEIEEEVPRSTINARLRQALEAGELATAARWCRNEITPDTDASGPDQAAQRAHRALCEEWRERRDARAETLLEEGRSHYSAGDIEEALRHWEEGLELAPDHAGLLSAHERALRVVERLESLRVPEPLPEAEADSPPDDVPQAEPDAP